MTLKQPADYLGFWWSAGDANNGVSFYSGNLLLGRFTTQLLLTLLNGGAGQVTAINQTKYNTSAYYGNPNAPSGRNTGEPYFFVDVVTSGTTFDKVIFDNSGTTSTGFESDNHTVTSAPVTLSGDHVFAGSINITTPEPPAPWLLGARIGADRAGAVAQGPRASAFIDLPEDVAEFRHLGVRADGHAQHLVERRERAARERHPASASR